MRQTDDRMGRRVGGVIAVVLATMVAFVLTCVSPVRAEASGTDIDTSRSCSVTLSYDYGTTAIPNVPVSVYRVADVAADGTFTLTGGFSSLAGSVTLDNTQDAATWAAQAQTLADYAATSSAEPLQTSASGTDGTCSLTGLKTGLYLVVSKTAAVDDTTYGFLPILVGLPQLGTNGAWVYQGAAASPKSEIVKTERLRVVKQWADEGNEAKRPTSVKVQILHEGTVVDTRTLDASNDWSYAWDALADGSSWTVQEVDVPDGYSASVTHDGAVFTLVNTYTNPGGGTPTNPGVPWTGDPTSWIVIVAVALVGLALVLVGRAFSHRDDGE